MKQSFQNIIDIIIDPKTAFTRLKYEPKWVAVLTIYCLFSFILAWALLPYMEQLLAARSVDTVSYSKTISVISFTVFTMGYSLLMAILFSGILTITVKITKRACGITFRHISAGFFHIMLIRTMTFFLNVGLLPVFRDVEDIHTAVDNGTLEIFQ